MNGGDLESEAEEVGITSGTSIYYVSTFSSLPHLLCKHAFSTENKQKVVTVLPPPPYVGMSLIMK